MSHDNTDSNKSTDSDASAWPDDYDGLSDELQSDYGELIAELEASCLPDSRTDELVTLCVERQQLLDRRAYGDYERLFDLLNVTAEAFAQVEEAAVVSPENLPENRPLDTGVPSDDYVITSDEREAVVDTLVSLLFLLVETPIVAPGTPKRGFKQRDSAE